MDVRLRVLIMNVTKVGDSYPILPFGIVACTYFPTNFLEIAVYKAKEF